MFIPEDLRVLGNERAYKWRTCEDVWGLVLRERLPEETGHTHNAVYTHKHIVDTLYGLRGRWFPTNRSLDSFAPHRSPLQPHKPFALRHICFSRSTFGSGGAISSVGVVHPRSSGRAGQTFHLFSSSVVGGERDPRWSSASRTPPAAKKRLGGKAG